ncbi:MAG TPA: hypothetical protein DCL38_09270 [Lachnospiraceae bacterium]|nr:hypothetical protein [Lachnospiraceae bacterium]
MNSQAAILNGRYRLTAQLGRGGSGRVFLAEDIRIKKKWAVKFIPFDTLSGRELAGNEIRFMESMDHPAFPRIVDAFRTEEGCYIVSDYIDGRDMRAYLKGERLPLRLKCEYALRVLSALRYMHERKPPVLYLDLKPENVMITGSGEIRLVDFGIARGLMEKGVPFGTRGYAAPEQYKGGGEDQRSDIFAFGMFFYYLLTLCDPVADAEKQRALIRNNNSVPKGIRRIILRCTALDMDGRYAGIRKVERELRKYLGRPRRRIIRITAALLSFMLLFLLFSAVRR